MIDLSEAELSQSGMFVILGLAIALSFISVLFGMLLVDVLEFIWNITQVVVKYWWMLSSAGF